jgi:hypothetical protein
MTRSMRPALLALLVLALAAGCGGSSAGKEAATATDLVGDSNQAGGPDYVKSVDDPAPGAAMMRFVAAARAKDVQTMWDSLSKASKQRVGGTYANFKAQVANDFIDSVGAFVPGKYEVVTSATVGGDLAVASIAGDRKPPEGGAVEFETFGAAMYKQLGKWRLEVFGPGALTLLVPEERTPQQHVSAAVDAETGQPVLRVGMWFDGKQYASPTEGPSPTEMSIFSEPGAKFADGNHTLLALVDLGDTALATAWTFIVGNGTK